MTVRVEMEPGWEDNLRPAIDAFLSERLGPAIASDAARYAPVRTGHLRESIGHHMEDHTLIVEATAEYAAYVEMGHRIAHGPRMSEVGPKVVAPRPYLRPALYQQRGIVAMTLTLHTPNDMVAVAWISTITGLTADGVATQLPTDENSWAAHGFVVVPLSVGGSPHEYIPVRAPVMQVECWATVPGSDKLPWWKANQLAEQIRYGTYDRLNFGRVLTIAAGTVAYPSATVKSALMLTEPRRIWSDAGDYAGYTFDLQLHWVQVGEVIP